LFSGIKNFFKKQNIIIYVRFRNERIYLRVHPSGYSYDDMAMIAISRQGKKEKVTAVGSAVMELPEDDLSVVYTPFTPFSLEPDNFLLAEKNILYLLKKAMPKSALLAPRVIMHPDKSYVGEEEEEAYRELALSAGAREAVVYTGKILEPDDFEQKFVKTNL